MKSSGGGAIYGASGITHGGSSNKSHGSRRRAEAERAALKARERSSITRQQQALRRQQEFREKTRLWNEHILPRWEREGAAAALAYASGSGVVGGGRVAVRDLCHKGIPPNIRGKVWPKMIGNVLEINEKMFEYLNHKVIEVYGVNFASIRASTPPTPSTLSDPSAMAPNTSHSLNTPHTGPVNPANPVISATPSPPPFLTPVRLSGPLQAGVSGGGWGGSVGRREGDEGGGHNATDKPLIVDPVSMVDADSGSADVSQSSTFSPSGLGIEKSNKLEEQEARTDAEGEEAGEEAGGDTEGEVDSMVYSVTYPIYRDSFLEACQPEHSHPYPSFGRDSGGGGGGGGGDGGGGQLAWDSEECDERGFHSCSGAAARYRQAKKAAQTSSSRSGRGGGKGGGDGGAAAGILRVTTCPPPILSPNPSSSDTQPDAGTAAARPASAPPLHTEGTAGPQLQVCSSGPPSGSPLVPAFTIMNPRVGDRGGSRAGSRQNTQLAARGRSRSQSQVLDSSPDLLAPHAEGEVSSAETCQDALRPVAPRDVLVAAPNPSSSGSGFKVPPAEAAVAAASAKFARSHSGGGSGNNDIGSSSETTTAAGLSVPMQAVDLERGWDFSGDVGDVGNAGASVSGGGRGCSAEDQQQYQQQIGLARTSSSSSAGMLAVLTGRGTGATATTSSTSVTSTSARGSRSGSGSGSRGLDKRRTRRLSSGAGALAAAVASRLVRSPSTSAASKIGAGEATAASTADMTGEGAQKVLDVTEEEWFENERNGSLNAQDFDAIHRQLFISDPRIAAAVVLGNTASASPHRQQVQLQPALQPDSEEGVAADSPVIATTCSAKADATMCGDEKDNSVRKNSEVIGRPATDAPVPVEPEVAVGPEVDGLWLEPPLLAEARIRGASRSRSDSLAHAASSSIGTGPGVGAVASASAAAVATMSTRESSSPSRLSSADAAARSPLAGSRSPLVGGRSPLVGGRSPSASRVGMGGQGADGSPALSRQSSLGFSPLLRTNSMDLSQSSSRIEQALALPDSVEKRRNLSVNSAANRYERLLSTMSLIEWDLPRTYPTLGFFHDGGPMHLGLERVLMCFVCYRPDIGYVQGMSYLVASLLLYMDEFDTFKCLANLLNKTMLTDFYCLRKEAIDSYVLCFDFYFAKLLPLLHSHLAREGVTSEMFLMDWVLSLFTKALPLEIATHIWDIFLFEGEIFLLTVGLGILKMYAPRLSTYSVERISPFLLHLPENIKADTLFHSIAQIQITRKSYERTRKKMLLRCFGAPVHAEGDYVDGFHNTPSLLRPLPRSPASSSPLSRSPNRSPAPSAGPGPMESTGKPISLSPACERIRGTAGQQEVQGASQSSAQRSRRGSFPTFAAVLGLGHGHGPQPPPRKQPLCGEDSSEEAPAGRNSASSQPPRAQRRFTGTAEASIAAAAVAAAAGQSDSVLSSYQQQQFHRDLYDQVDGGTQADYFRDGAPDEDMGSTDLDGFNSGGKSNRVGEGGGGGGSIKLGSSIKRALRSSIKATRGMLG